MARNQRAHRLADFERRAISARIDAARVVHARARAQGIRLETIDIGGGFGIRYTNEAALGASAYARALADIVRPLGCRLLIEPGRAIVGPAGVLLTRVLYVKKNRGKTFVVVDAAMNDLIRPVLYDAVQPITAAVRDTGGSRRKKKWTWWGPMCESTDFLARDLRRSRP